MTILNHTLGFPRVGLRRELKKAQESYWAGNSTREELLAVAAVLETTAPDGYSGAIQLLVGADFNGTVLGTRVTEHHETPGLGDKIELRLSDWITHFAGKKISGADDAHWAVKKDGGDFDQFTGATITPRAVVNAVKRAGLYAQTLPSQLSQLPACGE